MSARTPLTDHSAVASNADHLQTETCSSVHDATTYNESPPIRRPAGCWLIGILVVFVLYVFVDSLLARPDSHAELVGIIIMDVLAGVAIIGFGVLTTARMVGRARMLAISLYAMLFFGTLIRTLIAWNCFKVYARLKAVDYQKQQQLDATQSID